MSIHVGVLSVGIAVTRIQVYLLLTRLRNPLSDPPNGAATTLPPTIKKARTHLNIPFTVDSLRDIR